MSPRPPRAPDEIVDAIQLLWKPGPDDFLLRARLPEDVRLVYPVLSSFPAVLDWDEARMLAESAVHRRAVGSDMRSLSYPHSFDRVAGISDTCPAAGDVLLSDGAGRDLHVSEPAFDRLLTRILDTLIAGAVGETLPETGTVWWPDFVELTRQIAARSRAHDRREVD